MKIAIFSDNFYPELSGISDSIISLAKGLAKLGHKINFYVPKHPDKNFIKARLPRQEIDLGENIKIIRLISLPFPSPTQQARLVIPTGLKTASIKKFEADVIHSQLFFGVGLEALIDAKVLKIPFVGTNHTRIAEFVRYSPVKSEKVKNYFIRYMIWYYNQCDFVTAPSRLFLEEMISYGFNRPSKVISNPIDNEIFNCQSDKNYEKIRQTYNLSPNTVIYAGRLAPEKSIDVLIKAIAMVNKEIPDINLALAGHGAAAESLKKLADELKVTEKVRFLGTFEKPALADLYRAAKIFVMASTSEVQSLTVMQSMSCGLPQVCVNCNSMPDLVGEQNGFLVKPGDYKALAEKIILLLKDKELWNKLSLGSAEFSKRFSSRSVVLEWEDLYKKVIMEYKDKKNLDKINR